MDLESANLIFSSFRVKLIEFKKKLRKLLEVLLIVRNRAVHRVGLFKWCMDKITKQIAYSFRLAV